MARSTSTGDAMSRVNNPFLGKSLAAMKKQWSSMTPDQRKVNVENFRKAAKVAPKPTKAVRSAPTSTSSSKTKAQKAISGVGPSNAQRKKDSSPKAMAAYDKRAKAFDGPGPSRAERKKSMSAEAMAAAEKTKSKTTKPKYKGASSSRKTGSTPRKSKPIPRKSNIKYNRRGRRIK